jgi:hypothetical protein
MVVQDGQWLMEKEDMDMEEQAFKKAIDALLPVARMYYVIEKPWPGKALAWVLRLVMDDLVKAEPALKDEDFKFYNIILSPRTPEKAEKDRKKNKLSTN